MAVQPLRGASADSEQSVQQLNALQANFRERHLSELFAEDALRFSKLSLQFDQIVLDYSKHRIDAQVMQALISWAHSQDLRLWVKKLFSNAEINPTEQRAAMHWALRLDSGSAEYPELSRQVHQQLDRMYALVEKIHAGQYRGASGEVIQDVVNIGVGGSDLGPLMVTHALSDFKVQTAKPLGIHFVSTMDGSQLSDLLHKLRPETTLFIISSKSLAQSIRYPMRKRFACGWKKRWAAVCKY